MTNDWQWIFIGAIFSQAALIVFIPGKAKVVHVRREVVQSNSDSESLEDDLILPAPVVGDELDGATLRERKLAKIKAREAEEQEEDLGPEVQVDLNPEVHVAEEYVVEVTAESIEETDIEDTVKARRIHHAEIRKRIEDRRRGQMAEIRASTARMWDEHSSGEDIIEILANSNHGLTILEEPDKVTPGHPYGATFIRIDDERVLKLRIPLDSGFRELKVVDEELDLSLSAELPLPPLPESLPLPLPPPPLMESQSKLATFRNEIQK